MKGYHNNREATVNSITSDGWFKTGDIATIDKDGYYEIVDRKKELIKYKGFQGQCASTYGQNVALLTLGNNLRSSPR